MTRLRGFEVVKDEHKQYAQTVVAHGKQVIIQEDTQLPVRADDRSAGYDFYSPIDFTLLPAQKTIISSNVKAYMQEDEVLKMYPRSSMGIKQGLMLSNTTGIIDSSYYENPTNDGNIGLALLNSSGRAIQIKRGDRVAQGVFQKYLKADDDNTLSDERTGGIGSSGQ